MSLLEVWGDTKRNGFFVIGACARGSGKKCPRWGSESAGACRSRRDRQKTDIFAEFFFGQLWDIADVLDRKSEFF